MLDNISPNSLESVLKSVRKGGSDILEAIKYIKVAVELCIGELDKNEVFDDNYGDSKYYVNSNGFSDLPTYKHEQKLSSLEQKDVIAPSKNADSDARNIISISK